MLIFPQMNPVALQLGPLAIHWYGIMYLVGFICCWGVLVLRVRHSARGFTSDNVADLIFYAALGIIIGGRVGYMLFYGWSELTADPLLIFQIWKGGMSFHGGLIGVIISVWIYGYRTGKNLIDITDFIAPAVPIGLGAGRIGNFINGELWGRVTGEPWGMIFPNAGMLPRHPSQLYEVFFEGIVMFAVLWLYSASPRPRGAVSGLFLILYGAFRFSLEFFREPDPQMGFRAFGWMTQGQILSLPMLVFGMLLFTWAYWSKKRCINI